MTTRNKKDIQDDLKLAKINMAYHKKQCEYHEIEVQIYEKELQESE